MVKLFHAIALILELAQSLKDGELSGEEAAALAERLTVLLLDFSFVHESISVTESVTDSVVKAV